VHGAMIMFFVEQVFFQSRLVSLECVGFCHASLNNGDS
jgi:hypothetical protein